MEGILKQKIEEYILSW